MSVNRKDEAICSETSLLAVRLDDFVKGVGVGAQRERDAPHRVPLGAQSHNRDHSLGGNQESDAEPAEPPRCPQLAMFLQPLGLLAVTAQVIQNEPASAVGRDQSKTGR